MSCLLLILIQVFWGVLNYVGQLDLRFLVSWSSSQLSKGLHFLPTSFSMNLVHRVALLIPIQVFWGVLNYIAQLDLRFLVSWSSSQLSKGLHFWPTSLSMNLVHRVALLNLFRSSGVS